MVKQRVRVPRCALCWAAAVSLVMMAAGLASAGQEEAGIIGQVTDESKAVIPGVTVTVTGPALQVPSVVDVTDSHGEYRITPLPIGTYTVEYTLSGFQTVRREDIRLTVGFTAKLDVALKVGSLQETITISGAPPVVDVRSTTATTQLTSENIELLPSSRNGVVSILSQAPGVRTLRDVGGSTLNNVPTYRAFGQAGEAFSTLEGVWTSSLQTSSGQANYWDYTTLEEAAVRTIGNGADVPSRGVNLAAVVKSGGNAFHGGGSGNDTGKSFQSNNIDAALLAQHVTTPDATDQRYSYNGELGGRIIENKLWFYTSGRSQVDNHFALNTYTDSGAPATLLDTAKFWTGKASYQMNPSNRFVGFYMINHKYFTNYLSQFIPYDDRGGLSTISTTKKIEWQKSYGSSLVTSLQYGEFQYHDQYWDFAPLNQVPTLDLVTSQTTGPQTVNGEQPHVPRQHLKGVMTWYRPDLFEGNHEFKFGFDYADAQYGRWFPSGPANSTFSNGAFDAPAWNYQLVYKSGVPFEVNVFNNPTYPNVISHYLGIYAQDSWTIARRLTLNLGARYAHDNGYVPASCRVVAAAPGDVAFPAQCFPMQQFNIWNAVAPRAYAAYDVSGNGKTVIKGGWGRFDHERQQDPELDGADPEVRSQITYHWHAPAGTQAYVPGSVNLDPNGPDFVSQSGGSVTVPNPNEKEPISDEFSLSLEHELFGNFSVRMSGVYARTQVYRLENLLRPYSSYNVPVTAPVPGPNGVVGPNPTFLTYYEYPTSLAARTFSEFTLGNDYNATESFSSFEFAATKRLSNRWQLLTAYSATYRNLPVSPYLVSNALATSSSLEFNSNVMAGDLNPNAQINTSDRNWEQAGKVTGVYMLPFDVMFAVDDEYRGGYPWARQVLFTGGTTIPSITLNVEPIGTRRFPGTNQLDLRLEKSFKLPHGQKVSARVNVFNAFNANTVTDMIRLSGPNFMLPTSIMAPRLVEIGGAFQF
jgi:hypothetical protein